MDSDSPVTVYTLPDCISCALTMRAFERRGITPRVVEMSESDMERFRSQGAMSAPVVEAPGWWWYGLRPDLIQEVVNGFRRVGGADSHRRPRAMGAEAT